MLKIYISYADEDRRLVREIEKVTKPWVRQQLIEIWHKEVLLGGGMEKAELLKQMQSADIVLVCLSPDYLFADDLYEEMQNAIQLRDQASKVVIPVLLRDLDLNKTAFKGITPLPSSRVSLSNHKWSSQDEAFYVLSKELERVIQSAQEKKKEANRSTPAISTLEKVKKYQVGLSFAGEDRSYVEQVADALKERGVTVFYDAYEEASLWGKDLYQHLNSIYKNQCEYTIIFISKHYARKLWTQHELKAAQTRAFTENREYILPIRLDGTELPGFNETILYLDGNSKKPHEIANLVWRKLRVNLPVIIGNEQLVVTEINFDHYGNLKGTQELKISDPNFQNLELVRTATNLRSLDIYGTKVSDLGPIEKINTIVELNLSETLVSNLDAIKGMNLLTDLRISETLVQDLSPIAQLHGLKSIWASNTKIKDIEALNSMPFIEDLDVANTSISDLNTLQGKSYLKTLIVSNTNIEDLSPLQGIKGLSTLLLSNTQVGSIEPIKDCRFINELRIDGTNVRSIEVLRTFTKLSILSIHNTPIIDLSPILDLLQLKTLYLSNRLFSNVKVLEQLVKKKDLEIIWEQVNYSKNQTNRDNRQEPVPSIPLEILEQGDDAILTYLNTFQDSIDGHSGGFLNEVKVILIGGGGVGKTSLIRSLIGEKFNINELQTHGIQIRRKEIEIDTYDHITVHFWDFGGQEINHSTHQFFFSRRCVYVLVLDSRQDGRAEHWLKLIGGLGGNSPILVVLNKIDENPGFEVNRKFLLEKYPQIKAFSRTSCLQRDSLADFRSKLIHLISKSEFRKSVLPKAWLSVKRHLSTLSTNFITYEEYFEICRTNGVMDNNQRKELLELLNDLGIVLHFKELERYDKQVLNPKWLTNGVYRIINSRLIGEEQKGRVKFEQLGGVLNDFERYQSTEDAMYRFPEYTHIYLMEIMRHFRLCYQLDKDTYIVPDLLPVEEPSNLNLGSFPLKFALEYENFLPRTILPQFMVEMHHRIPKKGQLQWRTGMVLEEPIYNAKAVVRVDADGKKIEVWVAGERRADLLSYIRRTFDDINNKLPGLEIREWLILLEDNKEVKVDYKTLLALKKLKEEKIFILELMGYRSVIELLSGIGEGRVKHPRGKRTIFISYSQKDMMWKEKLKVMMDPLRSKYKVEFWDDRSIDAGQEWEGEIIGHLESDPIILFLVSPDFLATKYITEIEIPRALERVAKGDVTLIPIILRPCLWNGLGLEKFQALPDKAKPMSKWNDPDEPALIVARGVEKVLADLEIG